MGKEKMEQEKKMEDKKAGSDEQDKKKENPPPSKEIVLKVYMHCHGCARKVSRCLNGFQGIEDVMTDCKSHKVVVKGENVDPMKVLERIQRKSHRRVELISPVPKPPEKSEEVKEKLKPEEKTEEQLKVITVVMKVHMHCEACAQETKKRILRMKGVESAEADFKGSQVTVKGTFEAAKLIEYVCKRTGKHAVIVKQEPDKPPKDGDAKEEKKADQENGEKNEVKNNNEQSKAAEGNAEEGAKVVEIKKCEYQNYPPRYGMEMYAYPPQIFSDENPNACTVM